MTDRRRFFDAAALRWDDLHPPSPERAEKIERGLALAGGLAGRTVLDVGCGTGVLAPHVLPRLGGGDADASGAPDPTNSASLPTAPQGAGRYLGLDFAAAMIARAEAVHRDGRARFLASDLVGCGLPDGCADVALLFDAFPHFPEPARALAELHRLLRPGGRLVIWHAIGRDRLAEIHRRVGPPVDRDLLPSAADLAAIARGHGFSVLVAHDEADFFAVAAERRGAASPELAPGDAPRRRDGRWSGAAPEAGRSTGGSGAA